MLHKENVIANINISNIKEFYFMDWSLRKIKAKQLEKSLSSFSKILRPKKGWVRTMRETLGMNARQLGERCNVSAERIIKIEADELLGKPTIATLEKMAAAMNCRLVYGFIPNSDLIQLIEQTALTKAINQLKRTSHSMSLEDQETSNKALLEQADTLKEEMLRGNIKYIWDK